jgi:hypothetical protein
LPSSFVAVRIHLRQSLLSRVAGGGLNEYQALAPDGAWCDREAPRVKRERQAAGTGNLLPVNT